MPLLLRIKELAEKNQVTFAEIERTVGISNGQLRRWDTSSPKIENVQKVADYFSVSTDYLLGRTTHPELGHSEPEIASQIIFRIDADDLTDREIEELKEEGARFLRFRKSEIQRERSDKQ